MLLKKENKSIFINNNLIQKSIDNKPIKRSSSSSSKKSSAILLIPSSSKLPKHFFKPSENICKPCTP